MDYDFESNISVEEINHEKFQSFVDSMTNSSWMLTAEETTIDIIFNQCATLQELFLNEEEKKLYKESALKYPEIDFSRSMDILMENLITNPNLSERLTLYSINKYMSLYSPDKLCELVENVISELSIKKNLKALFEKFSDHTEMDWNQINSLLVDLNSSSSEVCSYKILNSLKNQTSVLLNAIEHGSAIHGRMLIDKLIECLDSQNNINLWFLILKKNNINTVLILCEKYSNFLNAILKFFDKFADEIETNYDEKLNTKYCNLNFDFEEFVDLLKLMLSSNNLHKTVNEYIENKILGGDKNYLLWIDIKACL